MLSENKPTILVASHDIGLQRSNIQIGTHVLLCWSPSPPGLAASPVASWSSVSWATNCQLAVDVHIIIPLFEAKSGKIEKLLGFFFILVIQGVIPRATGELKTAVKLKLSISNRGNVSPSVGRLVIAKRKRFTGRKKNTAEITRNGVTTWRNGRTELMQYVTHCKKSVMYAIFFQLYPQTRCIQICPEMQVSKMHAHYDKHHKVSPFL